MAVAPVPSMGPSAGALLPMLDDPNNTHSLGASAIQGGTIYLHLVTGVTMGAGQTQTVQTATLTAINAALAYAGTSGLKVRAKGGMYEVYGALGVVVPVAASGITWEGSKQVTFSQFYANAPILSIGDLTGATTPSGYDFRGVSLQYGVSQTGNALATALNVGIMQDSVIAGVRVNPIGGSSLVNPAYTGVMIAATAGTFSNNSFYDIDISGAQNCPLNFAQASFGNHFYDLHISNGVYNNASASFYNAVTTSAIVMGNSGGTVQPTSNTFHGTVIENISTGSHIIILQNCPNTVFDGVHVRNVTPSNGGCIFGVSQGNLTVKGLAVLDMRTVAGTYGSSVFFGGGYGELIVADGVLIAWSSFCAPGLITGLSIAGVSGGASNDTNTVYHIRGVVIAEEGSGNTTTLMTLVKGVFNACATASNCFVAEIVTDTVKTRTVGFTPTILGNYTHYGCHKDAVLILPATLAAATTVTLSGVMVPSGLGSTVPTDQNNTVRTRRQTGTYANALTIKDGVGNTTLVTNSAAASDYIERFNGSNWVASA
jgi:hypothetical protein